MRERWVGGEEDLVACRARSFLEMGASSEIRWRVRVKLKGERETLIGMLRVDWVGWEVSSQVKGDVGQVHSETRPWSRRQVKRVCGWVLCIDRMRFLRVSE